MSMNSLGWKLNANSTILESILKKKITINNNANLRRNFVSIELFIDFMNHLIYLLKNDYYDFPNIINITSNNSLSLYDFAYKIKIFNKKILNNSVNIELNNKSQNMVPFSYISNKTLKKLLPNSVNYEIDRVIYKNIEFYNNN